MKNVHLKQMIAFCYIFVLSFALASCETSGEKTVSPPNGTISPKQAMALSENYTDTRYNVINKYLGRAITSNDKQDTLQQDTLSRTTNVEFMDNRSSWWSLKDLENYIEYAHQEAKNKGYVLDGLRIYQGAYPNSGMQSEKKIGLSTVFIVPTGKKAVGQQGSMISLNAAPGSSDLKELYPLNEGHSGNPPHANYPQN